MRLTCQQHIIFVSYNILRLEWILEPQIVVCLSLTHADLLWETEVDLAEARIELVGADIGLVEARIELRWASGYTEVVLGP